MTTPQERPPHRLVFIDVLRLIAAFQMIQGHSIAAVLAPSHRAGLAFQSWTFLRGLTSVIFLFSAGFAFALAEQVAPTGPARTRRMRRALRLVLFGYALHTPLFALLTEPPSAWLATWSVVDVLQCIGVSLLSLELLCSLLKAPRLRVGLALVLALLAFFAASSSAQWTLSPASLLSGNYLTARYGSLFPLLPWAGYLLVGFGLGTLCLRRSPAPVLGWAALSALTLGALSWRALPLGLTAASPGYSLVKLGCVLLLSAALARALGHRERLPRLLSGLASETLFLYVSHVLVLYADGVGLAALLGNQHSPLFGAALALVLIGLSCAGALWLRSLRAPAASGTRAAPSP
jgi:acyltransferase